MRLPGPERPQGTPARRVQHPARARNVSPPSAAARLALRRRCLRSAVPGTPGALGERPGQRAPCARQVGRRDSLAPAGLPGALNLGRAPRSTVLFVRPLELTRFPFLPQLSSPPHPSPGAVYFALGLLLGCGSLIPSGREWSEKQFFFYRGVSALLLRPLPLSRRRTPSRLCFPARGLRGANLRVSGSSPPRGRGRRGWRGSCCPLVWRDLL